MDEVATVWPRLSKGEGPLGLLAKFLKVLVHSDLRLVLPRFGDRLVPGMVLLVGRIA